jgi:hypothetical protein
MRVHPFQIIKDPAAISTAGPLVTKMAQPKSLYLPGAKVKKLNSAVKKRMTFSCFFKLVL